MERTMQTDERVIQQLAEIRAELVKIGKSLMLVYGIVAIFACLYFGLMLYLLFLQP
jgi:hypothetical protein